MPATYEPIASTTLSSAQSSITFSSIPNTYTDLRVVLVGTSTNSAGGTPAVNIRFNSDSGTNYSATALSGNGSAASSGRGTSTTAIWGSFNGGFGASIPCFLTFDIFSYAASQFKTVLVTTSNDSNGSGFTERLVSMWRSTSAVTSINIYPISDNLAIGTTATLYGIKAA